MITDLKQCPVCKSKNIKKQIWKGAGPRLLGDLRVTIDKFGIGCLVEWVCPDCGFKHTEN